MKKPVVLSTKTFEGVELNAMMASGNGKRLWVTYRYEEPPYPPERCTFFRVEELKSGDIVFETFDIENAIEFFNNGMEATMDFDPNETCKECHRKGAYDSKYGFVCLDCGDRLEEMEADREAWEQIAVE